jgi:hypothetical protein
MAYGFVYVLRNQAMPGIYKVGMTEGSPTKRANDLSSSTSVPIAFEVVCYAEVSDCLAAERDVHATLDANRVSSNREFFRCPVRYIAEVIQGSEYLLQFTEGELDYSDYLEGDIYPRQSNDDEPAEDRPAEQTEAVTDGGFE